MPTLSLKYCGSCNPQVDLTKLGERVKELAGGAGLTLQPPGDSLADIVVILCGCPRACGDTVENRQLGAACLVVAGGSVRPPAGSLEAAFCTLLEGLSHAMASRNGT